MSPLPPLQIFIDDWRCYLSGERRYSQHTVDNYLHDLHQFLAFVTNHTGSTPSINTIISFELSGFRSWLVYRHARHYSVRATARAVSSIRSFFRFLAKYHELINTAIDTLHTPPTPEALPKALTLEDSQRAIDGVGEYHPIAWVNARNIALLLLLYGCGLRIGEALALTVEQVRSSTSLHITGKGNKDRIIPLLPIVCGALNTYLHHCPFPLNANDLLFRGIRGKPLRPEIFQKTLRDIRHQFGLPDYVTPHAFRHSFATHLLQNHPDGMDPLRLIQQLLGHESLATTQRYTKIDSAYLLASYQKSHPLSKTPPISQS